MFHNLKLAKSKVLFLLFFLFFLKKKKSKMDLSFKLTNIFSSDVEITVQIDDPPSKIALVRLNLKDNLSNVREILEKNSEIEMNDSLSFVKRNSIESHVLFAEIT